MPLGLEILVCFLLLAVICVEAVDSYLICRRPLGYRTKDVWMVWLSPQEGSDSLSRADSTALQLAYRTPRDHEGVVAVAEHMTPPFRGRITSDVTTVNGVKTAFELAYGGDNLDRVVDLEIVAGRWFRPADAFAVHPPVVISHDLAVRLYGDADPVGQPFVQGRDGEVPFDGQVVGVLSDHRLGPFRHNEDQGFTSCRADLGRAVSDPGPTPYAIPPSSFTVRVPPGATADLERSLRQGLDAVAPGWNVDIMDLSAGLETMRFGKIRELGIYATVGGFLVTMVGLGLGVFGRSTPAAIVGGGLLAAVFPASLGSSGGVLPRLAGHPHPAGHGAAPRTGACGSHGAYALEAPTRTGSRQRRTARRRRSVRVRSVLS